MADYQIVAIRADGPDRDYRIDAVQLAGGGIHLIDEIINWIRSGAHNFWTRANGKSVWVVVRQHPTSGRLYLATENDGYPPNNLLSLPRI